MCGILFWVLDGLPEDAVARIETHHVKRVGHRGTDGTRVLHRHGFLHAFHRLAIINTSESGMQPFTSEREEDILIGTGEVWNYQELVPDTDLRSDVDVFLRLDMMATQLDRVDGDFAFVRSTADRRFWAARDIAGVRPLFYATNAAGKPIAFASEAKALVSGPSVAKVAVFPPGHLYDSLSDTFVPYHAHDLIDHVQYQRDQSPESVSERVHKLLTHAVHKRVAHSDRPVGILCSGGVDSAIVTAIVNRLGSTKNIRVFTMEYENSGSQDAFYARMLCQFYGLHHTVVSFTADMVKDSIRPVIAQCETYDPNTIRAAIPMYLLAKYIAEHTDVKVILSGEGADELFAGYLYFMSAPTGDHLNDEARRLLANIHMFDLLRADRCFAAFSLEVRVPYLDKDLMDYVTTLQGDMKKFRNGAEKMLLRDSFKEYQELVQLRILERPKERFSDGCGFSYVPHLLNFVSDHAPRLDDKLKREKEFYMKIFDELYTPDNQHWIAQRELPAWASGKVQDVGLD